jgi:hypothetical protein
MAQLKGSGFKKSCVLLYCSFTDLESMLLLPINLTGVGVAGLSVQTWPSWSLYFDWQ